MNNKFCPLCDKLAWRVGNVSMVFDALVPDIRAQVGKMVEVSATSWNEVYACNRCKIQFPLQVTEREMKIYRNIIKEYKQI